MDNSRKKRHPLVTFGFVMAVLAVIFGLLNVFFIDTITPPPDGPTGIPIGSTIEYVTTKYPGHYYAMKNYRSYGDARALSKTDRSHYTGDLVVLDYPKKGDKNTFGFVNGKIDPESERKDLVKEGVTADKFIERQSSKASLKQSDGPASFRLFLPQDMGKLDKFDCEISIYTNNNYFSLDFTIRGGKVVGSMRRATSMWY